MNRMTTQRPTASRDGGGQPLAGGLSVVVWLVATGILAFTPLFYFAAGGSDGATESERFTIAIIMILVTWPLLAPSITLARRARTRRASVSRAVGTSLLLLLLACLLLEVARRLGNADALPAAGWTLYWLLCAGVWLGFSWILVSSPLDSRATARS
jgi:hypothetical protein